MDSRILLMILKINQTTKVETRKYK